MNDRTRSYETQDDKPPGRFPRWAKVLAVAVVVAALIVLVMSLVLGGGHGGPSQHF